MWILTCRCDILCRIRVVQIQPRKRGLDNSDCTASTRQHELDYTDQEQIWSAWHRWSIWNRWSICMIRVTVAFLTCCSTSTVYSHCCVKAFQHTRKQSVLARVPLRTTRTFRTDRILNSDHSDTSSYSLPQSEYYSDNSEYTWFGKLGLKFAPIRILFGQLGTHKIRITRV